MSNILQQVMGNNNNAYIKQINQFANQMSQQGRNPQAELNQMVTNGQLSQQQLNQAWGMAENIARKFFGYKG